MIYFTSDTHFYHQNIIHLCQRPFYNYPEMHNTLIQNWNCYITDYDDVYILGDFIYKGNGLEANELLKKLKGRKYLIRGNHDRFLEDTNFESNLFQWVKDYYILNYEKRKFVLFHYPILEWEGYYRDSIHLYGHVHNWGKHSEQETRLQVLGNRAWNVGVDVNEYHPISIKTIIKKLDN